MSWRRICTLGSRMHTTATYINDGFKICSLYYLDLTKSKCDNTFGRTIWLLSKFWKAKCFHINIEIVYTNKA